MKTKKKISNKDQVIDLLMYLGYEEEFADAAVRWIQLKPFFTDLVRMSKLQKKLEFKTLFKEVKEIFAKYGDFTEDVIKLLDHERKYGRQEYYSGGGCDLGP